MNDPGNWQPAPRYRHLPDGVVHVWRIAIDPAIPAAPHWSVLSPAEQARALRYYHADHRTAYVLAHVAMRTILAAYEQVPPGDLAFDTASSGKPVLPGRRLEFNLSHSGTLALLAVARDRAVGIDIEQWNAQTEYTAVAKRFFSSAECDALRSLSGDRDRLADGFFAAWCRKEAYVKATGNGVSHGLDHFDVSLAPEHAALLADRKDTDATSRWTMFALAPGAGYSAALVAATPASEIVLFDAPPPDAS